MFTKITFVGAGDIGSQTAFITAQRRLSEEIVLLDIAEDLAKGRALDISHSLGTAGNRIKLKGTANYSDTVGSDLVVVSAGKAMPSTGEYSRDKLLADNINIFKSIFSELEKFCPTAIVIIITNPVDVLATWVHRNTKFPHNHVIGFGNMLDSLRYQFYSNNPNSLVIGEHGNDMVLVGNTDQSLTDKVIFGAKQVIELLGNRSTMYAPAMAISNLINAIAHDTHEILPVGVYTNGELDMHEVVVGLPSEIGREGIIKTEVEYIKLTPEELQRVHNLQDKTNQVLNAPVQ